MDHGKINILLIEDNRLLQEGITAMLHSSGQFEVVARFDDADAVRQLKSIDVEPDVVLLDMGLERMSGLSLMALLRLEIPAVRIVAMDILPNHIDILEFIRAGGDGFILKNALPDDWFATLKAVAEGKCILPSSLTQPLFNQIMEDVTENINKSSGTTGQLTRREHEIVDLIAEGLSNKEIAESLNIATFTVKSHVHNILEKLVLNTRLQIAAYIQSKRC